MLDCISHFLADFDYSPIRFPSCVFEHTEGCLFEIAVDCISFALSVPEVFRCEIHLKLKFGDIVEEEEDNVEARDDASHVAEKIEQFVVAALIDDTFIERFEDHIGGGIC